MGEERGRWEREGGEGERAIRKGKGGRDDNKHYLYLDTSSRS